MKDTAGAPLVSEITWTDAQGEISGQYARSGSGNNGPRPFADSGPQGVPFAKVDLTYTSASRKPVVVSAMTDQDGHFIFTDIPAGAEYSVRAGAFEVKGIMPAPPQVLIVYLGPKDTTGKVTITQPPVSTPLKEGTPVLHEQDLMKSK